VRQCGNSYVTTVHRVTKATTVVGFLSLQRCATNYKDLIGITAGLQTVKVSVV